jgi:HEAT repeat protein
MLRKYLNYILFAAVVLVVLGIAVRHSRYVHGLVDDMGSGNVKEESAAALELIKTEQFSDSITGEPVATRVHAAEALEALGNDTSVVPDTSVKEAPDYRAAAVKQAIGLLKDTEKQVRDRAVTTLEHIGDSTPANLKELVNGVGDGDNYVRKGVKAAFTTPGSGIGPRPGVVEAIVTKMKADDPTRAPGGDILGSSVFTQSGGNATSVPLLIALLTEKDAKGFKVDEGARSGAADALGKIGDAAAVPTLIQSMHDDTPHVRRVAIGAIALIASASGEPSLEEALTSPDDDKEARAQAASGLGKIGTPTAIAVLVKTLQDTDQDIRSAAVAALARAARPVAGAPAVRTVLASLTAALASANPTVRLGATRALQAAMYGASETDSATTLACSALISVLADDKNDDDERAATASALGFAGDKRAVGPLIAALSDPDGDVSLAARDSLAAIGSDATAALITVIKKGGTSSYYASQALARQGAPALPALQAAAADSTDPVGQRWAAVALGDLGITGASATLKQLSHSTNEDVAYVAKEQLNRLGQTD